MVWLRRRKFKSGVGEASAMSGIEGSSGTVIESLISSSDFSVQQKLKRELGLL